MSNIKNDIPTPDEHYEKCSSLDDAEISRFMDKVIDVINRSRDMSMTVSTSGIPFHARKAVMKELKQRGWDVKLVDDFRDGSYLYIINPKVGK